MIIDFIKIISEVIIFGTYVLICAALLERRFSRKTTVLVSCGSLILIFAAQAAVILSGQFMLALSLLPLTVYLPATAVICVLSKQELFVAGEACAVGLLGVFILKTLDKIRVNTFSGSPWYGITLILFFITAALLVFSAFRLIGKGFKACAANGQRNRLLTTVLPLLVFLLMSYFLKSVTNVPVMIISLFIAILVYVAVARLLLSTAELARMQQTEKLMWNHMEIQRRDYQNILNKVEQGRIYRHDMRHHFLILEELARRDNAPKILDYVGKLKGGLTETGQEIFCKNPTVNAVLSTYISQAQREGCVIKHKALIPEEIPFEEMDVCIVLANALENAVCACRNLPEKERLIKIYADYSDKKKLILAVKNPCMESLEFDGDGFPVASNTGERENREPGEHGIGLRSVRAITEKYNGLMRCKCADGQFAFDAVLFNGQKTGTEEPVEETAAGKRIKLFPALFCFCLLCAVSVSLIPDALPAASGIPSGKSSGEARQTKIGWGDTYINEELPDFTGEGADELNEAVEKYIQMAREEFLWYAARQYKGYTAEDTCHTTLLDDDRYFILRFDTTINAGGSVQFSRCITFDKEAGEVISLGRLFREGSDYIGVISQEILRQMEYRVENKGQDYYIPGGIWKPSECFKEIDPDQNFYIDSDGQLVIVFDEYEVAPGSMGMPEFVISDELLCDIKE